MWSLRSCRTIIDDSNDTLLINPNILKHHVSIGMFKASSNQFMHVIKFTPLAWIDVASFVPRKVWLNEELLCEAQTVE